MKPKDIILDEGWMIGANWFKNNGGYVPQVNPEDIKVLVVQQNSEQIFNVRNSSDDKQSS